MPYRLFVCGSNGSYQLGLGNNEDHNELQEVKLPELDGTRPKSIVFGGSHTLLLFPDGKVFATGDNGYGQCGVAHPKLFQSFTQIPGIWLDIACGWEFSVLRSTDGHIYSCGKGPKGELGLGNNVEITRRLTKVDLGLNKLNKLNADSPVRQLKANFNHVIIQMEDRTYIGWGNCSKGQLGEFYATRLVDSIYRHRTGISEPTRLDIPLAREFSLGKERTILFNPEDSSTDLIQYDNKLEASSDMPSAEKIECGWSSMHVLSEGTIISKGKNTHGQLFDAERSSKRFIDFAIGSEHGVALSDDNIVYAWGWGEHGNCGPNHVSDFELCEIYRGEKVVDMFCGLATTWIVTEVP